uniref:Transcription factor CBF/NF-Y/archaeal histone domain-containing protein n=1 Tax=Psilocybe cubensis TaxID=181762 RepID=A0A8H7XQ41_PSICU
MSSNLNGLSLFANMGANHDDDTDVEAELEVDQLDSDTDPDEPADSAKSRKPKNGTHRPGERVPGHTLLPAQKLENMIQAEGVTGNMTLSKEGLFVLSIATEEFIKRLVQAGHREAIAHCRNQINYTDMAATTGQYQEFMCLSDTIPPPISLADALALREQKERDLIEDNPALSTPFVPSAIPSPEPEMRNGVGSATTNISNSASRSRNGKPSVAEPLLPTDSVESASSSRAKAKKHPVPEPEPVHSRDSENISASTSRLRHKKTQPGMEPEPANVSATSNRGKNRRPPLASESDSPPVKEAISMPSSTNRSKNKRPPSNSHGPDNAMNVDMIDDSREMDYHGSARNGSYAASSLPTLSASDHLPTGLSPSHSPPYYSPTYSREESVEPASIPSRDPKSLSHSPPYDPVWTGQFTGPASGFLQGPSPSSFGRPTQNPGRTIYSQSHRSD